MKIRVEPDRHFACTPGRCVAPVPSARRLQGRQIGRCRPRRIWWLRVNDTGRRESFAFKTEAEARVEAAKAGAARVLGQAYRPRTTTPTAPKFAEVAGEALKLHVQLKKLQPATVTNHQQFLRLHLLPAFGNKPVTPENFSRLELRRFIAKLRDPETGLSDSTITVSLPTLRLSLDYAVERGLIPSNPMTAGGPLWHHQAAGEVDPFTSSELRAIVKAARVVNRDFATLIQTMVQAGLRPGEVLGLRRGDVDLQTGVASVRGSWSLTRRRRGPTKTPKSTRAVSLLHPVTEDRGAWRPSEAGIETHRVLDGLRVLQALAPDREAPLFPAVSNPSKPMEATTFYGLWRRILKASKVTYRKPHALRHSFASILLSRGANLLYLVRAGGWTNGTILLKVYSKWIEEADPASSPASKDLTSRNLTPEKLIV